MIRRWWIFLFVLVFLFPACQTMDRAGDSRDNQFVLLASTIGPIDAGIVGALEEGFEKETGIRVRHVGTGTGAALKMAEGGQFDLVLAHAKSLEEKFVKDGFGTQRIPLMYNDFVIVGPAADPAGVKGMKTAAEALRAIAAKKVTFITRGDKSGTHVAELDLWEKSGVKPAGSWYVTYEKGSTGNVPTLLYTDEKQAYTVIDRATHLSVGKKIKLPILVENDEAMLNFMSLIPVNSAKFPRVNAAAAMQFVEWMTAPEKGQAIIRDFGKDQYGAPMFFPNSAAWHKKMGK
ncbi:MAG: substrate-binding domain-containing protein [Deltaproteobacteria bacterium]|nr:substrate-binding domain-containing protein [Deltaproteobacteria bacterium]